MIIRSAFKMLVFVVILTGLIYPLLVTTIARFIWPEESNGSQITIEKQIIGSALIAQNFKGEVYFWPRPSAINYDPIKPSGGSNLGPTSKILKEMVEKRAHDIEKAHPRSSQGIPPELVYASGSGLDPHIGLQAAYYQMERIVKARSLTLSDKEKLKKLVESKAEGRQWGFLGPRYVNVLLLNQTLDQQFPLKQP
jgi:potassium-transporting ATPase KdpC subunit